MRNLRQAAAASLAVVLLAAAAPASAAAAPAFRDLGGVPWAAPYINDLATRGIMQGTAPGVFDPDALITRGQLALVLARTWPAPTGAPAPTFTDVTPGSDLAQALRTAWPLMQPVLGASRSFDPEMHVQRQQVFAILGRIEVPISGTAFTAQHQAASVLSRFRDASSISADLAGWVAAAVALGIAQGTAPGVLDPQGDVTRAQLAVLVDRTSPGNYFGSHSVTVLPPVGAGTQTTGPAAAFGAQMP